MKSERPVAVITGAAGGIGRAIVRALAATHEVVSTDVRAARPAARSRARHLVMDVRSERAVRKVRDEVLLRHGRVDLLVFASAVLRPAPVLLARAEDLEDMFEVNVVGAARCLRIFGEPMIRQRGGRIILLGSAAARRALKGAAGYAASKAALESLGRTTAVELAPFGVSVVTLAPGWVETGMTRPYRKAFADVPVGRASSPSEVAEMVAALANLETNYLTGTAIQFDGGISS